MQGRSIITDLSVDARLIAEPPARLAEINARVAGVVLAALAAGAAALGARYGWRQGALFVLGGGLGVALYHALFGFTSA